MSPILRRRMLLTVLALPLAGLMFLAGQAGIASLYYFQAAFALDHWQQQPPVADDYQQAATAISQAAALQPGNPHYLLMQAKINEWGWHSGYLNTEALAGNEALYQQAIALRPDWPVAYADYGFFLGHTQFRLTDAWTQMTLARQHGAYLPQVQQKFLSLSFQYWPYWSAGQKAEIFKYLQQTLFGHLSGQAIALVQQFKLQRQSCLYLRRRAATEPQWPQVERQLCPEASPAP